MTLRNLIYCSIIFLFFSLQLVAQTNSVMEYTLPSNFEDKDCSIQVAGFGMSIAEKYVSLETDVSTYHSAMVADLDGDGFSEIVIPGGTHNNSQYIYIFNHKAELKHKISLPEGYGMHVDYDSVILADLDNNGKGEIIVTASNGKAIFVYDYEGKLLSQVKIPINCAKTTGVADFNQDGIPEIYVGTKIYNFTLQRGLTLIADTRNSFYETTVAQDVTGDGVPELVSVNAVYQVEIKSLIDVGQNMITQITSCNAINSSMSAVLRTFALADVDLDGSIDVVTVVPVKINDNEYRLEVKVWDTTSGVVNYTLHLPIIPGSDVAANRTIRNSWPFIGDADADGVPDIIFMGGINVQGYTSVYRIEYDKNTQTIVELAKNNQFNDFSSMCTGMSMFDFNKDGEYEIVYRDQSSLFILNGKTLEVELEVKDCHSGTGWEYPVIASLTPDNESFVMMASGTSTNATTGTLRIYGADTESGAHPWMIARKVWNQYSFYQNQINDNLTIIANPAPLNYTLTSVDGSKTLQPFNGHMLQLGIISPKTLESIFPAADIVIGDVDFGYDRIADKLILDIQISNSGSVDIDDDVLLKIYGTKGTQEKLLFTQTVSIGIHQGDVKSIKVEFANLSEYSSYEKFNVKIGEGLLDCDQENNDLTIHYKELEGVFYVKKGEAGTGKSWADAMGELSDALYKAIERNKKYPNSVYQIWVAEGSYYGNFMIQEGIDVYGGFSGKETSIEQSRPLEYPTVLDAQGKGRPLTQYEAFERPTVWRGFTLQNGKTYECGGGALIRKGMTLSYSIIKNNIALQGGGVCADNASVFNCIIEENIVENVELAQGAGIYAVNNSTVINNTIVKNSIGETFTVEGAGVYASASFLYNNIIYKNTGNSQPNNLFTIEGLAEANLITEDDATDPLFTDFENGDYQLLPISPALNVGNNAHITEKWICDIAGLTRIYASAVDQGAFEYQGMQLSLGEDGSFYVNEKKEGNGSDWENALNNLSDALLGAKLINESKPNTVQKIWVASGTYQGTFEMVEGANLHGGFAGNETDFNQMDTLANKTYIDALGEGRALTQQEDFNTPTEWVGVILQNGYVSGIDKDVYGGGAYLKKNGILRYSSVRNSKAVAVSNYNEVNAYGGGVYLEKGASLTHSTIEGNIAQITDNSEGKISNGVAQGGGVNNVGNRLSYLVVRGNQTISETNTDGGAIYTSEGIVNSIVDNNNGQTAIYLVGENQIVNSTIVSNHADCTIYGQTKGLLQNSIVYGNIAVKSDFYNVEVEGNNNLVNVDPSFKVGSFELEYKSKARAIGNASFFPSDLDKDIVDNDRFISLKDNIKVLDAGAYQSDIKVVSAVETAIEVPFGTTFEELNLKNTILGILEFGYEAEFTVSWIKGNYNELVADKYTLSGGLSNLGDGVVNPDEVQGTIDVIVKQNHIAEIEGLRINNEDWLSKLEEDYLIDCDYSEAILPIVFDLPYFASISFAPQVEFEQNENNVYLNLDVSKPGNYNLQATVTSQDGKNQKVYPISIVKYFPFWSIIEQRWNNTFVINNNKETNGGYEFVSYQWYKDGKEIGTKQYYSAGPSKTDLLDEQALYYAKMIDVNGIEYFTCTDSPVLMSSGLQVSPNPVKRGEAITIKVPLKEGMKGSVSVYSLSGLSVVTNTPLSGELTEIKAPTNAGIYILRISLEGGVSESLRIIVY